MGNFGGLTALYVRLLASRCMPADGVALPDSGPFTPRAPDAPKELE
jgi:hypothetical protein